MNKVINPKFLVRLAITVAVCSLLFYQLKNAGEISLIKEKINSILFLPIFMAAAIFFISLILSTVQWKMLLDIQNVKISLYLAWQFYMIGQFFSNFLPTNWGGDFVRIYDSGAYSQDWEKSTASIIMDRVLGLFALFLLGLVHAFIFYSDYFHIHYLLIVTGFMILGIILFIVLDFKRLKGLIRCKNRIIKKISDFMDKFFLALARYQHDSRLIPVLGIAIITQYLRILMNVFIALSLGFGLTQIPFVNYYVVIPIVGLLSALPIAINGIGVREMTGSFMVNNMLPVNDNTISIMFTLGFLVMTSISLLGAVYFIQHQTKKNKLRKKAE